MSRICFHIPQNLLLGVKWTITPVYILTWRCWSIAITYDHIWFEFSYICLLRSALGAIDLSIVNGLLINLYQNKRYVLSIKFHFKYITWCMLRKIKLSFKDVLIHLKEQTFNWYSRCSKLYLNVMQVLTSFFCKHVTTFEKLINFVAMNWLFYCTWKHVCNSPL